ncbi:DUF6489 family protein [Asticcacaulis sp. 201]|uniref:DUF6489 family protein n=1 Tax=Asticcacaulis sp. 201 TaxID=3028787 RepID=UPI0029167D3A|nr:DUF6489 family protein [Asticcacaulis sp. 201]MDV6331453.1 DUF6489 family protein [Asticcacaulis sp. 201]
MKVTFDIECTPEEARAFLGLPDVQPLNDFMVEQMRKRVEANIHSMKPEEIMKSWSSMGVHAQDQFMKLMQTAAQASLNPFNTGKTDK